MSLLSSILLPALTFVVGLGIGLWLWHNAKAEAHGLRVDNKKLETQLEASELSKEAVEKSMRDVFKAAASEALNENSAQLRKRSKDELDETVNPLNQSLTKLDEKVRQLEEKRVKAYTEMDTTIKDLRAQTEQLKTRASDLAELMRSPVQRGNWGEFQLRRIVEWAGMKNHVHFDQQVTVGSGRPDLVVHMASGGELPVDAKVPMDSFRAALEAREDEATRNSLLKEHAKAVKGHVSALSGRAYQEQFERAPEFVIMFVPSESALAAAFDQDASLFEYAYQKQVLLVSPLTLLACLKAFAFGWQQQQLAENAIAIRDVGLGFHNRLEVFVKHFARLGTSIGTVVDRFNDANRSLDSRLRPGARKFRELGAATNALPAVAEIEKLPIPPRSAEQLTDDGEADVDEPCDSGEASDDLPFE